MKSKYKHNFDHIESFRELHQEKSRLYYEVRLSRKKLDLALMELGAVFNPGRLVSVLVLEWLRPVSFGLRHWLGNILSKQSRR